MKQLKWLLVMALTLTSWSIFAQNPSEQLNQLLSNFQSMTATFEQKVIVKKGKAKNSSGTMALQRPGKFRWEISEPNHQVIVADGKYLWIYDVDLEQATKQSLTKDANSPALLLSGSSAAIQERFSIEDSKEVGDKLVFKLKPKGKQDMLQSVELEFTNKKLSEMSVIDHLGQRNVFHFSNVMLNPNVANKLFQFHAPRNVDVIQN
jgi:outer membrane lipoprotein carrier protein